MRSTWKGTVSCGLLNVPAKLYAATEEKSIKFNSIHRQCQSRISMPKFCPTCERKVEQSELVKGYDMGDDNMVLFEEEELSDLKLSTLSSIEVLEFIQNEQFDPRLPKKSYYLAPDKGGTKGFGLLAEAMAACGVCGIVKLAMREKEHLGLMSPFQSGVMLLQTLFWEDELRSWGELVTEVSVKDSELELAGTLIRKMSGDGILAKYKDGYRESLEQAIEAKLRGEVVQVSDKPKPSSAEEDLTALLEASISS